MNYKVYNTDTSNWMTYHRDGNGHYSVVHEGLPRVAELYRSKYREVEYGEDKYLYDTIVRPDSTYRPWYCPRNWEYDFTEIETKTTKTRRDIYRRGNRMLVRKQRPVRTLKTEIYF